MVRDKQEKIWMCVPCADEEVWTLQQRFPTIMRGDRFTLFGRGKPPPLDPFIN